RSFFFQAEDGIRDFHVTGVQTCALPIFRPCRAMIDKGEAPDRDGAEHRTGTGRSAGPGRGGVPDGDRAERRTGTGRSARRGGGRSEERRGGREGRDWGGGGAEEEERRAE